MSLSGSARRPRAPPYPFRQDRDQADDDEHGQRRQQFGRQRDRRIERDPAIGASARDTLLVGHLLGADGALQAEVSDHESETAASVYVFFGEAVWCTEEDIPVYRAYRDPIPPCGDASPARIEYFFELAVSLGPCIDLAIGQDPDFLWLIAQVEEP